jgi:membrane-bound metal-dependent hydrolase YbcI (DUF457 family)
MDVGTHVLASIALTRALVPRARLRAWIAIVTAGTLADIDALGAIFGPSAYLDWHHTYTHSILATAIVGVILGIAYFLLRQRSASAAVHKGLFLSTVLLAGFLHLAMDACQSDGITAFWPFSARRVAADWLPSVDPWIIAILIAAILLPELSRLVRDEIGAKNRHPRGQIGAIVALILTIIYVGVRADIHAGVLATIQARTYRAESPRRAAAYPEYTSLFTWHAIVETDRALLQLTIDAAPGASFDPETGTTLFKPEPSPILDAAQNTESAKKFLRMAKFPKASMEKIPDGYQVQIRDLWYVVSGETRHEIIAMIRTDTTGRVTDDNLLWARPLRSR